MPKLLIVADDLTGALDTGVKFSEAGLATRFLTDWKSDLTKETADVVVLCAPTRHLPQEQAYEIIRNIVERNAERFPYIMKKTDSGLRGNIGAELQAVLDGAGARVLTFFPALPEMRRTTYGGVQYIDGVPVSRSVFGRDPFDPVLDDDIPSLLRRQCRAAVRVVPEGETPDAPKAPEEGVILVCDATSVESMRQGVSSANERGTMRVTAGCAGLAQVLAGELAGKVSAEEISVARQPLLVVCGSVNRISTAQLDYAERNGFERLHVQPAFLLNDDSVDGGENKAFFTEILAACQTQRPVVVDTISPVGNGLLEGETELPRETLRQRISQRLGQLIQALLRRGMERRVMIIGGDTLSAFIDTIGCRTISPLREIDHGVVLSRFAYDGKTHQILSKSGGFGGEELLVKIGRQ